MKAKQKQKLVRYLSCAAGVIAALLFLTLIQPSHFTVARTAVINASPGTVFAQVNDLHNWNEWSPWAKLDPKAKTTFEGSYRGKGAKFNWDGNSSVGKGSMTVIESKPYELVKYRLDFVKPMKGTDYATFTFRPNGDGRTKVTWSMDGTKNFAGKFLGLIMNCNKMIGGYFEQGLANLNRRVSPR